jgi:hypothetical protein
LSTVREAPIFGFPLNEAIFLYAGESIVKAFHVADRAAFGKSRYSVSAYIAGEEAAARAQERL